MELGEPDLSGRPRPVPIEGSEYEVELDSVIVGIGQGANPLLTQATKGLDVDKRGRILTEDVTQMTSIPGVFAGGDIVTGAATVILAMGAGRRAARSIKDYLGIRDSDIVYLPERSGHEGALFGIDVAERNFTRVRVA